MQRSKRNSARSQMGTRENVWSTKVSRFYSCIWLQEQICFQFVSFSCTFISQTLKYAITFSANVTFRDCRSAAFATFSEKPTSTSRLRLFFLPIHNFDMCLHDGFVQLQQKNNPTRNVDFLADPLTLMIRITRQKLTLKVLVYFINWRWMSMVKIKL